MQVSVHSPSTPFTIASDSSSNRSDSYSPPGTEVHKQDSENVVKKRKLRKGKVVGLLRQRYAVKDIKDHLELNLAPSGIRSQLGNLQLSASLTWHLVNLSTGVLTTPNSPPILEVSKSWTSIRVSRPSGDINLNLQEVFLASLAALGSRRSFHSHLVGVAPSSLTDSSDIDEVVSQSYGVKREGACRALAQRAVDLAEKTSLLEDHSSMALEVMSVLRVTLFAVNPRHPFSSKLASYFHEANRRRFAAEGSKAVDDFGLSIPEYDAYIAMMNGTGAKISDSELDLIYGWNLALIPPALERVRAAAKLRVPDHTLQKPCRDIAIGVLRGVLALQREDVKKINPAKLSRTFTKLWSWITTLQAGIQTLHGLEGPARTIAPHLGAIPMVFESTMCHQAERLCKDHNNETLSDILELAKLRFLKWLHFFLELMDDDQFLSGSETNHTRGLMFSMFDLVPFWVQLILDAASQHELGVGPLACAEFTWTHIRRIHLHLKLASAVFARSARQESRLRTALLAMGKEDTQLSSDECAKHMVTSVISQLAPSTLQFKRTICTPRVDLEDDTTV